MTEVDEKVARYILTMYREEHPDHHLSTCEQAEVIHPNADEGVYGCDTGCEYVRFEATIRCPHEQHRDFEYGDFGDLASILADMDREPTPAPPMLPDQALTDAVTVTGPFPAGENFLWCAGARGQVVQVMTRDDARPTVEAFSSVDGRAGFNLLDSSRHVLMNHWWVEAS